MNQFLKIIILAMAVSVRLGKTRLFPSTRRTINLKLVVA